MPVCLPNEWLISCKQPVRTYVPLAAIGGQRRAEHRAARACRLHARVRPCRATGIQWRTRLRCGAGAQGNRNYERCDFCRRVRLIDKTPHRLGVTDVAAAHEILENALGLPAEGIGSGTT
jgi:hypothetical protein